MPWIRLGFGAVFAALLLAGALAWSPQAATDEVDSSRPQEREQRRERLPKVAIVGASASAGFGVLMEGPGGDGPGMVPVRLADLLRAIAEPSAVVLGDWSSSMFFRSPVSIGDAALARAAAAEAAALVAIDFLFWFAYGSGGDAMRMRLLEQGLQQLDRFEGPIVVGDIPDMSPAVGGLISASQVPSPELLAMANARVRAWAAERPRVRLLPMSELTRHAFARAGIALRPGPSSLEPPRAEEPPAQAVEAAPPAAIVAASDHELGATLQRDRLHPTFDGLVAIVWVMLREGADLPGLGAISAAAAELSPLALRERIRQGVLRERGFEPSVGEKIDDLAEPAPAGR